jgi:hypothetical protein|tara:strand:- start:565 stop:804 length:240 start_codon:yes stop_codon:yes gene_type:complete
MTQRNKKRAFPFAERAGAAKVAQTVETKPSLTTTRDEIFGWYDEGLINKEECARKLVEFRHARNFSTALFIIEGRELLS